MSRCDGSERLLEQEYSESIQFRRRARGASA